MTYRIRFAVATTTTCLFCVSCEEAGGPAGPNSAWLDDAPPSMYPEEPLAEHEDDAGAKEGAPTQPEGAKAPTTPTTPTPPTNEPSTDARGPEPAGSEFDVAVVCSSEEYWGGGYSENMRPGAACISCHQGNARAPKFSLAGTVFPTAHEPDDCHADNPAGVQVELTGADGRVLLLNANGVGNFMSLVALALPYTARVIHAGRSRPMLTPQRSGDCNACHTQDGASGAPGRILLP